jgi:hypothetical protein
MTDGTERCCKFKDLAGKRNKAKRKKKILRCQGRKSERHREVSVAQAELVSSDEIK